MHNVSTPRSLLQAIHHWRYSWQDLVKSVSSGVQISKYTRAIFGWETGCSNLDYQKQNLIECSLETLKCALVSTHVSVYSAYTANMYTTYMYSQSVPCMHLNNLWTDTCITVSSHGTCFGTVGHVQRMAKCTLKEFEEVSEIFGEVISQDRYALSLLH